MEIKDLQNKMVAVLGYGVEGKAVAEYLIKHGIKPVLFDQKPWSQWLEPEQEKIKKLELNFIFGPDMLKELKGFDYIFRSPGIKVVDVRKNISEGAIITSQTKFFFEHCPAKIIGVTGTKGKGTTSTLIYEILKENQLANLTPDSAKAIRSDLYLTGNIGKTSPLEILDSIKEIDFVVFELSSFQLQDLQKSPHIGVVLMTTVEHLDYHSSIKEYVDAKKSIVEFQEPSDFAIINSDFEGSAEIGKMGKGKKLFFSRKNKNNVDCFIKDGQIFLNEQPVNLDLNDLQLKGAHNLENICAALLATNCLGINLDVAIKAIKNFKGLEHRLEFAGEKNGVKFYNDSFSTTPEAAIAALESFTEPEILILGGSEKKSDFSELGKKVSAAKNIKALILIGKEAARIKAEIKNFSGKILEDAKNMQEIFEQIKSVAENGDVVVLSPACASFDMFVSYKDRGEQFKKFASNF